MMIIPPVLRRAVEVPYVVHRHRPDKSQGVYGTFATLAEAEAFRAASARSALGSTHTVARLDLPILPAKCVDWALWSWTPRPGLTLPKIEPPPPDAERWVTQVDSERFGQRTYGPFATEVQAEEFCRAYCELRGGYAWGRVFPLLSPC